MGWKTPKNESIRREGGKGSGRGGVMCRSISEWRDLVKTRGLKDFLNG